MNDTPVYLVTGFLGAGKTKFINESIADPKFADGEKLLVIACEEGEEEICGAPVEYVSSSDALTPDTLALFQARHGATKLLVEYNGMWQLSDLFDAAPENWIIGQSILFFDAGDFAGYNKNMRSLVVDKIGCADMIVFNRVPEGADTMELHRIVRAVSRNAAIIYESVSGEITYDEIEDPLPFDKDADVIEIADRDFALFYRDLCENMSDYDGKTISLTAMVANDKKLGSGSMFLGRHVMICCKEDIQYSALVCKWGRSDDWQSYDWVHAVCKIKIARHKAYEAEGPVLYAESITRAEAPAEPVATFY